MAVAVPSLALLAVSSVALADTLSNGGSVIAIVCVAVQVLASVAVTVKVPAPRLSATSPFAPLLHAKVYPGVPPLPVAVAEPSLPPKQDTSAAMMLICRAEGWFTVADCAAVQPFPSVTVAV